MTGASLGTKKSAIGDRQPELEALCRRLKAAAHARDHSGTKLHEGEGRNNELTRRLGLEVAKGVTGADLARRARELNNFDPPLDDVEVEKILSSAEKWPVGAGEPLVCEAATPRFSKTPGWAPIAGRSGARLACLDRACLAEGRRIGGGRRRPTGAAWPLRPLPG